MLFFHQKKFNTQLVKVSKTFCTKNLTYFNNNKGNMLYSLSIFLLTMVRHEQGLS